MRTLGFFGSFEGFFWDSEGLQGPEDLPGSLQQLLACKELSW